MKKLFLILFCSCLLHAATLGETLFHGNCITCHEIATTNSAPAIKEVQAQYKQHFATEERFIEFMVGWLQKPNAKTAIMRTSIAQFGLMPTLGYDEETLREIATFLYNSSFEH